jgi:hypothetical protein
MKMLIILTTIIMSGSSYAFNNSTEYVEFIKQQVSEHFRYSMLECNSPGPALYSCKLVKTGGEMWQYEHEYRYLLGKMGETEKTFAKNIATVTVVTEGF